MPSVVTKTKIPITKTMADIPLIKTINWTNLSKYQSVLRLSNKSSIASLFFTFAIF